ncbi:lecithin retinol acyltransferase family protein [Treponema phagedenis]|uniref:lecithin retinol acyltransferase family protein n=1 Tax=Treponema phagedenis TaxID=162 RepID=UPI0011E6FFC7|nr:lecithin retinol acyltransferase family protein [Treponema phagedenis]QEJ95738.1 NC domain protein [Treponema phagedenis]QEK05505.1 NC domain protein [Treponema phagedenis]
MKKNLAIQPAQAISLSEELQRGDIIFVNKGLYKHYGIYIGNNTVVHYSDKSSNFGVDIKVQEASLADFADGFEVKVCRLDPKKYTLYSADETVKRAYLRLGEKKYNLIFNNCEHFAVWCKTGISDSAQVHQAVTAAVVISIGAIVAGVLKMLNRDEE